MLFRVSQNPIREDNPEVDAVPEFVKCSDKELRYVFLVYDYESPLRKMEKTALKEKAATMSGYKLEKGGARFDKNARTVLSGKNTKVETAIKVFLSLQRNFDKEVLLSYESELEQFVARSKEPKTTDSAWRISLLIAKELPMLLKNRKELLELLEMRNDVIGDNQEAMDDGNYSTLDTVMGEIRIENENKQ